MEWRERLDNPYNPYDVDMKALRESVMSILDRLNELEKRCPESLGLKAVRELEAMKIAEIKERERLQAIHNPYFEVAGDVLGPIKIEPKKRGRKKSE